MPTALSCSQSQITFPDGETLDRLPFMPTEGEEQCVDCGVHIGGFHHIVPSGDCCDQERCPRCGAQLLMCLVLETCDGSKLIE